MSMTSQARPHFPPPQHQQIQSYPSSNGGFGSPPSPLQTAASHDQQQQQQRNQSGSTDLASAQADSSQQPWTYSYDSVPRPHEHSEWNQYPNAQHQQQHMSMQQQQQLAQDQLVQHYQQGSSPPPPHMAMSVHQAQQQQQHVQAMPPGQQAMQQFQQQQHQHQQHQHQQQQQQQQLQLQQQQQQQQHTFAALPANAMGPSMTFHRSSLPASFGSAPSEYYGPADPAYVQHRASLVGPTAWLPGNYPFEPQGGEVMPDMMTVGGHHQPRKLSVTEMPNGSPSRSPTSSGKARKRQRSPTREDPLGGPAPKFLAKRKNSDARVTDRDGTAPTTIFQCRGFGDCNMTFTRSEHLARHIRKHTGERPFGCHCGKAFSRLDNLRQHAQTVHSDESERNELMMSELTNLHAHLAASAARDQHAQAFLQRAEGQGAVVRKHRGPKKGGKNGNEDGTAAQMGHSSASPTFPQPHSAGFVQHDPSYMSGAGPHFGPRADGMAVSHLQQHPHSVHYDLHQFGPSASSNAAQRIPESSDSTAYPYGTAADAEMHHIGSHNMRVAPSVAPPPPGYIHVSYGDGLVLQQQANPQQLYSLGPDAGAIGPHQNVSPYQEGRYPHSAPIVGGTGPTMSYAIEQIPQHLQQQAPHQTGAQSKADSEATTRAQINDEHNVHPAYNSLDAARGESHTHSKAEDASFGTFFSDRYAPTVFGSQDAPSALPTRKEDAAKASTSTASLPSSSQGGVRPMTASGEPAILLPPLSSLSRPTTAKSTADALSAVKQLPSSSVIATPPHKAATSGTASVSWGTKTIIEGRSRPPTSSGELEASMRFHRRNSMLDLPEMGLHRMSRPVTSSRAESSASLSGQMRPPEAVGSTSILPPPSRSGRAFGSFDGYTHHQVEKLRPFSSSGRLGSSSGLSALGDMFRTPLATRDGDRAAAAAAPAPASRAGRWERPSSSGQAGSTARKTSPNSNGGGAGGGSSPFRFHPPPLTKEDSTSGSGNGSGSTGVAASFFKDRPLTTSSTRRERAHLPIGRPSTRDGATRPLSSQQAQRALGGSSSTYPSSSHEFRRPCTAGDLGPPRAFGASAYAHRKSLPDA